MTATTQKNSTYFKTIIEVAPFTCYDTCTFKQCEFAGIGPVTFRDCTFDNPSYSELKKFINPRRDAIVGRTRKTK